MRSRTPICIGGCLAALVGVAASCSNTTTTAPGPTEGGGSTTAHLGGSVGTGGGASTGAGGLAATGGAPTGGSAAGGATSSGGKNAGGTTADTGGGATGGATSTGGTVTATGGTQPADAGAGGQSGGTTGTNVGPCDIYQGGNTPCVAAHSTVRALYGAYSGNLYQVRRASDKTTKDIPVLVTGGFADTTVQDAFCAGTTCTISILYDQTSNKNDLVKSTKAYWLKDGGNESSATLGKAKVNGHAVYGIYVTGNADNVAYRNNSTKGIPTGDQSEAMYMVLDAKRFSTNCCFDYGNAETNGLDNGNGTMECLYWGSDTTWGGTGGGNGPWVAADLENGMFKGNTKATPTNTSITGMTYATGMLKGPSGNHFTLKAGNAQSGKLEIKWDGPRPTPNYSPKKLEGAIILGTGGDGSNGGTGTFFEGAITMGNPTDAIDDAVQENIVGAGYGR